MENENLPNDEKYDRSNTLLADNDELITAALRDKPELLAHYKAFCDAQDEYEAISVKEFYSVGFKRGFKLALEIFDVKLPVYFD